MGYLESIKSPRDLRALDDDQLADLASEIRDFLVSTCSTNGGHLGPNLGVVELTLAIHRVFDSPIDRVVFDTGHQAYVHKILTGRAAGFDRLKQEGGLSGYPSQAESDHDIVENSHASTSLSYADGLAKAYSIRGEDRHVVAVIGDGALTGGMAWEALNNIAANQDRKLVMIVNDNGRSYTPTVGGLANHLATLRTNPRYEQILDLVKKRLNGVRGVGPAAYDALHAIKKGMKDALAPQGLFEDLGMKYVGPIDGGPVMAVDRPDVLHAEVLEQSLRCERVLHPLLDRVQRVVGGRADPAHPVEPFLDQVEDLLVARVRTERGEVVGQSTDGGGVGATVVVDDHHQLAVLVGGDVVQRLPGHPAGQGAVADHRHHVPVLPADRVGLREPVGVRQRRRGVRVLHDVVVGLGLARVAGEPALLLEPVEAGGAAGQDLVHVGLVTGVEHDPVDR